MFHIKTYNQISIKGLDRFPRDKYEVASDIGSPDAYLLRSHKLHGEEVPSTVIAVARAGAGVNNVPVDKYTQQGIVVFNTPGANANAVKELVMSGLLLSSRGILQGKAYVETLSDMTDAGEMSKLLEQQKKRFAGSELAGKTMGIIGLGAIGSMVAEMASSMGMEVVGYDPALSVEAAWRLPNHVRPMENLSALLGHSDYVSLHVPALESTHHMINVETLKSIKPGAALLNFARDAIVDSAAVVDALNNQHLRQYICDFPEPGLIGRDDVIALPHIGASTAEAEENCAVMAVNQLRDFLEHGNIKNSVNFPPIRLPRAENTCRIAFSNDNVSGVLGHVLSIMADHQVNVIDMLNKSRGRIAYNILDLEQSISKEVLHKIQAVEHVINVRLLD